MELQARIQEIKRTVWSQSGTETSETLSTKTTRMRHHPTQLSFVTQINPTFPHDNCFDSI